MKLLVLGGTRFLGRHLVDAALGRGDVVTLFNRGQSQPGLFPTVESLQGDRDGGLAPLAGRTWDAVVDTCGLVPRIVRQSAQVLKGQVGHYTFVSSCSVYAGASVLGQDESAPVGTLADESVEEVTAESYGPLKERCERVVEDAFPGRAAVIRAGLIVGPHDYTDRFSYWPRRIAAGGDVLAPDGPDNPVQFVDGRDLAEWILRLAERGTPGTYNATGPERPLRIGEFLDACRSVTGSGARFVWADEAFLLEHAVAAYSEMPLWVPRQALGFNTFDCRRALAAGLSFRPLARTIADTWTWDATRNADERTLGSRHMIPSPLSREREGELLKEWAQRASAPQG